MSAAAINLQRQTPDGVGPHPEDGGGAVMVLDATAPDGRERHDLGARLRWMEVQAKLIDPQIAGHHGRVLRASADSLTATFESALDAVRCAIELQRDISAANASTTRLPYLELRIALEAVDAARAGGEVENESIATAEVLRRRAEPGGILVTPRFRALLRGAPGIVAEPLQPLCGSAAMQGQEPSRIELPQIGTAPPNRRAAHRQQPTVAILPFRSSAAVPVEDYFTGGIVENIVVMIARMADLVVVSRESTFMFQGTEYDLKAVGRQLGARYLVTGEVRRSGDRLEVSSRLVDTETDAIVWSDQNEVPLAKLFDLQEEIARRIAGALVPSLSDAELRRAAAKRPENLNAYDLLLQAMHHMHRLNPEDFAEARVLLDQAIQSDPEYAAAYTRVAMWHKLNIGQGFCRDENAEIAELIRAAARAVQLDPADAHALALLGHCRAWLFRDYDAALDLFERAFAVSPNSAFAWGWSSPICSYLGDGATAIAHAEYALRLCPIGPEAYFFRTALALAHYTNGNYEEAARWGRRSMAVNPHYEANLRFLAASLAASGRIDEAQAAGRSLLSIQPDFSVARVALRYSYKAKERNRAFAEHLRLAGLPD